MVAVGLTEEEEEAESVTEIVYESVLVCDDDAVDDTVADEILVADNDLFDE